MPSLDGSAAMTHWPIYLHIFVSLIVRRSFANINILKCIAIGLKAKSSVGDWGKVVP